ncbi:MAG TPA: transglutaminase family protein [Syntrophorhabdales bacterium]|nr:transglutaminase family protein [Syntrophorhabdales bacterium]
MQQYLKPTFFIDCDAPNVAKKSMELTADTVDEHDKAIHLFMFVRDQIRYNVYTPRPEAEDFKASHVLARGEGYCVQKAVLLVALARASRIPARLRFAEIRQHLISPSLLEKRGSNIFPYHGLADLNIHGRWIKATPTYDSQYCKKAGVEPIEFDGTNDALLPLRAVDGRLNVDYIKDRGFFEDLPLDEIRKHSVSWKYIKT